MGSVPEFYDTYLTPLIFEVYADDIADRIASLNPASVLEIAAGSGVVARALAKRLGSEADYTVTDLNQPMLDHAAKMQGSDSRITWRQADALELPFDDGSFDVVACQFGVMFFPDIIAGYSEARRVLKPGGSYHFSVWGSLETNEFAHVVSNAAAAAFPNDPPGFLPRTPYGYFDLDLIRDELGVAGFSQVSFVTRDEVSAAPSPRHAAIAFCQGTPLRNEIEARDARLLDQVTEQATEAIATRFGSGAVKAGMQAHIVSAMK